MFLPFVPLKVRFVPHPVDTGNSIDIICLRNCVQYAKNGG